MNEDKRKINKDKNDKERKKKNSLIDLEEANTTAECQKEKDIEID